MRLRVLTLVTAVATLVATLAPSASADDPPPDGGTITFVGQTPTIESTLTINQDFSISGSANIDTTGVGSQCAPVTGGSFCLGTRDDDVIKINGFGVSSDSALRWISNEAVDFLSGLYDVPNDDRITAYARPEIRAYVANRVLSIVTKAAYGQPLTDKEQVTLDWLNDRLVSQQKALAEAAYAEWQKYNYAPCGYTPPAAPSWVPDPRPLPGNVFSYCHIHPGLAVYSLPPMPSADDFRTWGMYRAAAGTGLQYAEPGQSITPGEMSAYIAMAGTAAAIAAGFGAYGLAQMSTTVAQLGVDALGLGLQVVHAASWEITYAWVDTIAVGAGAIGLAGLVVGIITALLNIALFSWQFAENMKVGPELAQSVATAAGNTDPLGLEALKAQNAGKTFPDGSHPYLDNGLPLQLLAMMTSLVATGDEPTGLWPGSAHTDDDLRFKVGDTPADQISVPKSDGSRSTVWFSKKWMIEQTHDKLGNETGPPRAVLAVQYLNPQGKVDIAYRTGAGFQIATVDPDDKDEMTVRVGPMSFKQADGQQVQVGVLPKVAPDLGGPRPSAAGRLVIGTPVNLRPNPVDAAGNFAGLDGFVDGYAYDWKLSRAQGGSWVDVAFEDRPFNGNDTYGARFVPTQAGNYRATVTMTPDEDPAAAKQGTVTFTVAPPVLTVPTLRLVDNGGDQVGVKVQATMNTPLERPVRVDIQWPGDLLVAGPGPTSTATVTCHNVDAFTCMTTDSGADFGDALTHTVTPTTRMRDGVKVTVSDVDGTGAVSQDLWFDSALRPSFTAPPSAPSGQVGALRFDRYLSTLTVPVGMDGNDPNFKIATVLPGSAGTDLVSIVDPVSQTTRAAVDLFPGTDPKKGRYLASVEKSGNQWVLQVYARTKLDDVGAYTVPLTIQQRDGRRATLFLIINPVVAPNQLFRGAVVSDIDPDDIGVTKVPVLSSVVTGGEAAWGDYTGQLCVSLTGENDATPRKCGPVADMVGSEDDPVPFPYEQLFPHGISGGRHVASAWLPASSRTWDVPISQTFIMASDPPDVEGLGWDGHKLRATITPGTTRSSSQPVPITTVSCTLDGAVLAPCFDEAGGELTPGTLAPGPHQLSVKVVDEADNYDTETYSFQAGLQSITVAPSTAKITAGRTQSFTATGHFSDDVDRPLTSGVSWTSSNAAVATVGSASGVTSGIRAGTVTIKATSADITGTATLTVTPSPPSAVTMPASWMKKWPAKKGPVKKARVGKRLKVTKPVYSAAGKKQHLAVSYQWYVGGKPIAGATKPKLKVRKAFKGKKVTLTVTVTKPGYLPRAKTLGFGKAR